jgi:hypothetical protein
MKTMNYFRKVYIALLALAVGFAFNSCGDDDDDNSGSGTGGGNITLDATLASTGIFGYAGESRKVTVTTTGDWAVKASEPSWVTFDPIRGSGNGDFTVKVDGHEGDNERTAIIIVSIDDTDIKKEIPITQDKVQAAWTKHETGVFSELMKGVYYFWGVSPALYYRHVLLKPGTLTIHFPNSHIHTFVMDKEPGYYEVQGDGFATTPTVEKDPEIGNAYDACVGYPSVDNKNANGDCHALCPRSAEQNISFHLKAGTYWTTHTLENDIVDDERCGTPDQEVIAQFTTSESVDITITFTPDGE